MLYDFQCPDCMNIEELVVPLQDFICIQACKRCGGKLKRLISSGGIQTDGAPWLRSTTEFLKDGEEETIYNDPVTSRKEYERLLKDKGLEPVG